VRDLPRDHLGVVRALIDAKADVVAHARGGTTPVMHAAHFNQAEAIYALVAAGARVDDVDEEGKTALFYAVNGRAYDAVKALAALGADVNHDFDGTTPLDMNAAMGGDLQMQQLLAGLGGIMWVYLQASRSRLCRASLVGNPALVHALLGGASADEMEVALVTAAWRGHCEVVKVLLAARADPSCYRGSTTPLTSAAANGDVAMARVLVAAKADITAKFDNNTAMKTAAANRHRDMVAFLLAKTKELKDMNK
jgi:ankyrin repeat protein